MNKNRIDGTNLVGKDIKIKGLVQGVGFRPFIYRLAHEWQLSGWVINTNESVNIHIEGTYSDCQAFMNGISAQKPWAAQITSIYSTDVSIAHFTNFKILPSQDLSDAITRVSPDIAVCDACLEDMQFTIRRKDYPLVNCTYCGPRFSIVKELPYDREHTTMAGFTMCNQCRNEYTHVWDRRFHAQPISCNHCGPHYKLLLKNNEITGIKDILSHIVSIIDSGGVITIKGVGGFHLVCDAQQTVAVKKLRNIKQRDQKPFAVMFNNVDALMEYTHVSKSEQKILLHWQRSIVLLKQKKELANGINPGINTLGVMLPYMPFHHLLFGQLNTPSLVMTSGNISDEPIVVSNDAAQQTFGPDVDGIVTYNREIHNRVDDSVVMVVRNKPRLIRRARGFVPIPIEVPFDVNNILATGAELVNCFALGKGDQVIMSQHMGDLKDVETYSFYTETIDKFKKLFRVAPERVAHDKHPDYLSTRYAKETTLPVVEIQHHHAHIAACMAEYQLDEPVIGVCFDGTGLGDDGHLWGGEFMYADYINYKRYKHFDYIPLPGGDKAIQEPWRTAIGFLYQSFGQDLLSLKIPLFEQVDQKQQQMIVNMIRQQINCPLSSGAGRLFDAVSAITGICVYSDFHAQAPMQLEALTDVNINEEYDFRVGQTIDVSGMIKGIVQDMTHNIPQHVISTKFHNTLVTIILFCVNQMTKRYKTRKVVLTGGVFQNKYLLEQVEEKLEKERFEVYSPVKVPCNDGGLALGQMAIAAKKKLEFLK